MRFGWTDGMTNFIIGLIVLLVIYAFIIITILVISRRSLPLGLVLSCFALSLVCYIFDLTIPAVVVSMAAAVTMILVINANQGDANRFLANPFKTAVAKNGKFGVEKIFDSKELYKRVETAVVSLSKRKIGALITFEKSKSLKNFSKNGVEIEAPVTAELLETIFYPGTRLHDGAVIIHGNQITAAAVFFVLTTQAFAVKYGSRHRAAIGISEVSDSVTIVVSEETGRISIVTDGQIQQVDQDNFLRVFENYMSDDLEAEEE